LYGEGNLGVYATAGVALAVSDLTTALATYDTTNGTSSGAVSTILHVLIGTSDVDGHKFAWDRSANKVKAFSAGSTEVVDTTDISAKLFQFQIRGAKA
jgi:hypothetical protein